MNRINSLKFMLVAAFLFHAFGTMLWLIGVGFGLSAQPGSIDYRVSKAFLVMHNVILRPILVMTDQSKVATTDNAFGASLGSLAWSALVGYGLCVIWSKLKSQRTGDSHRETS